MQTYTGGCHCGAVRFEVATDLGMIISCNCSHCHAKGLVLTFVPAEQFTLKSDEGSLQEYRFNSRKIQHLFCKTCGTQSFARGQGKDGEATVAINVRCLNEVDFAALNLVAVDGKSW